ncbi:Dienelactone hydrolase family protein [Zostera marina]|uniref:Dienelactone hydrolase family protein n=1 Tax=Zostera marina TaxID=29655 RepID=A0A0K9P314_ZOSMR|nr:Dienelactone hydrolase family protein [Zostera marina]
MSGEQCCENPPALNTSSGKGVVLDDYGGLKSYVVGSHNSTKAIILISDVFGFEAPNLRKLADKVAEIGFLVVVPDYFYGDPYLPDVPTNPLNIWIKSHMTDKGFEDSKPLIAALKSNGVTAIGAAGFCWGGKVVAELSKSDDDCIKAGVMIHPSLVVVEDIKEIKTPIAILGAETDYISPPQLINEFDDILSSKPEIDSFVKIFPGVKHGWSVRYDVNDETGVKRAEEAHQHMIDWFMKYVK